MLGHDIEAFEVLDTDEVDGTFEVVDTVEANDTAKVDDTFEVVDELVGVF